MTISSSSARWIDYLRCRKLETVSDTRHGNLCLSRGRVTAVTDFTLIGSDSWDDVIYIYFGDFLRKLCKFLYNFPGRVTVLVV